MSPTHASAQEPDLRIGTRQHYRWLHGVVCGVLVLNLCDAVFTLFWVWSGVATEANELMADWITASPVGFVVIKLGLVSLGTWTLWYRRHHPLAVVGIFAAFVVYYWILAIHADFIGILLRFHSAS